MNNPTVFLLVLFSAGATYILRVLPLLLVRRKLTNPFVAALLDYLPYAMLSAMIFPDIMHSTGSPVSATAGLVVALVLAFFGKSLPVVAAAASAAVFIAELF